MWHKTMLVNEGCWAENKVTAVGNNKLGWKL